MTTATRVTLGVFMGGMLVATALAVLAVAVKLDLDQNQNQAETIQQLSEAIQNNQAAIEASQKAIMNLGAESNAHLAIMGRVEAALEKHAAESLSCSKPRPCK